MRKLILTLVALAGLVTSADANDFIVGRSRSRARVVFAPRTVIVADPFVRASFTRSRFVVDPFVHASFSARSRFVVDPYVHANFSTRSRFVTDPFAFHSGFSSSQFFVADSFRSRHFVTSGGPVFVRDPFFHQSSLSVRTPGFGLFIR